MVWDGAADWSYSYFISFLEEFLGFLYFSARAVLGLCLFEHFDPASDTTRATPANHYASQSELKVESAAGGYTWPLHPTRQLAAFPHKRRKASLETCVWECLRGSCVRRQNNCFIFQLLVQKHKIFIIKVVSKVSCTCGYSHWPKSHQTKWIGLF